MHSLGHTTRNNAILLGTALATSLWALPVLSAEIDDTPIRLDMTIEIAGADDTDTATEKELKESGLPMVPDKPTASSRDPLAQPKTEPPAKEATDASEKPAAAAPAAEVSPSAKPEETELPLRATRYGYYLRLDAGYAVAQDMDASGRNGVHLSSGIDNTPVIGAGIGYRLDDAVRIEGSLAFRSGMDIDGTDGAGNTVNGGADAFDAMLNIYYDIREAHDLLGDNTLTPYVGAGIGLSAINSDDLATSGGPNEGGTTSYNLGYSFMAGVAAYLTESTQLDVGYRFVNLGSFDQDGRFSDGTSAATTSYEDLLTHEFRAGIRFAF